MKHKNALVFVTTGQSTTILKVGDRPNKDIIIFDDSKATVLTDDSKTTPAKQFDGFEEMKPYLMRAVK